MSQRAYYFNSITNFILEDDESVLGQLLINDEFETTDLQKMAWRSEIQILKEQLFEFSHGDIIFEYTIPRMGHRVNVICIIEKVELFPWTGEVQAAIWIAECIKIFLPQNLWICFHEQTEIFWYIPY